MKRKKKTTKNLTQDGPSLDREVKEDPPEYDAEAITLIHTISTLRSDQGITVRDLVRLLTPRAHSQSDKVCLRSGTRLDYYHYQHTHNQIRICLRLGTWLDYS